MRAVAVSRVFEILLVEDNPGDVRLAQEALRDSKIPSRLNVVSDGEEAMAFLRQQGRYQGCPRPQLILLDLNLPRKDGCEVLAEIKEDPLLRRIPVLVLTTSRAGQDVTRAYDLHANCYIAKPLDLDQYIAVVHSFEQFWLQIATLPSD